jgi:hypothetical protein
MEQSAARLVAELERSDREWRHCVEKLEKRCATLERDNAQLRTALHESEERQEQLVGYGVRLSLETEVDMLAAHSPYRRSNGAHSHAYPSEQEIVQSSQHQSEWNAYRRLHARVAQAQDADLYSAKLTTAGQTVLQEPLARLRTRAELEAALSARPLTPHRAHC